jgi:hypothetical protein
MFRLFPERDGKSGSMGVKAVTICPICHTRALVPTFVLEWRKFGAPEQDSNLGPLPSEGSGKSIETCITPIDYG